MSKDDFKLYIKSKADDEIREIIEEAENNAKKIIEESENMAKQIKDERLKRLERELDEKERAGISLAKMEGSKSVTNLKGKFLEQTFSEVKDRLKGLSSSKNAQYRDVLVSLVTEGALNINSREMEVSANKDDIGLLRGNIQTIKSTVSKMKGDEIVLEIDNKAIDAVGGVIVYSKDGKQIYNNTLEARLERTFEELKGKISTMLFEG